MKVRELDTDARTCETIERWVDMPGVMTVEEAMSVDALRRADGMRADRNRRLAESDWATKPDVPMAEATRAAWLAYRQALRDVTAQAGFPDAIQWPDAP